MNWGGMLVAKSDGCGVALALIGRGQSRANGRRGCCEALCVEKASGAKPTGGARVPGSGPRLRCYLQVGPALVRSLPAARMLQGFRRGRKSQFVSRSRGPGVKGEGFGIWPEVEASSSTKWFSEVVFRSRSPDFLCSKAIVYPRVSLSQTGVALSPLLCSLPCRGAVLPAETYSTVEYLPVGSRS